MQMPFSSSQGPVQLGNQKTHGCTTSNTLAHSSPQDIANLLQGCRFIATHIFPFRNAE